MIRAQIIDGIRTPFHYLFEDYDFAVIACNLYANSENWVVVLESPRYGRFLTLHDRGEIIIALGPNQSSVWQEGPWFDLAVIAEYLSQGRDMLPHTHGDLAAQLGSWADALHPYMERIGRLFSSGEFAHAHADLDAIGERREVEIRQSESVGHKGNGNGHNHHPVD